MVREWLQDISFDLQGYVGFLVLSELLYGIYPIL